MNKLSVSLLNTEALESGPNHGRFLISSLKSDQGITIGIQLRRVLLNDLGGLAISAVRIAGVNNEYGTIPGVREDILEIFLNLKGVIIKSPTNVPQFGRLKIEGPAVVTAGSIQVPSNLEIVNKEHYILTVSSSDVLEIEFRFDYGRGYELASQTFLENHEDFLQVDSIFMPVERANFQIETVYDTANNTTEQIILDIWTNGSITPSEALASAAKITIDLFTSLLESKDANEKETLELNTRSITIDPYTNIAIEELQLSVRAYNCLKKAQINTVGQLLDKAPEELLGLKNFGRKSAEELFSKLKNKFGIDLKLKD